MTEKIAFNLILKYITGWKEHDLSLILSSLAPDCVIKESHGPVYIGLINVEYWFNCWHALKKNVTKWDITSYSYSAKNNTAFIEWDFEYKTIDGVFAITGASVIAYSKNSISSITEYMKELENKQ